MTRNHVLNVKPSNSQINRFKIWNKNGTDITKTLSSNVTRNSNDETNSPHKLLLTDTQGSKICWAFVNGSSANIKFSKIV